MTTPITAPVPSSPDAWKKFYDRTYYNEIPFKASKQDTPSMYTERDLVVDASQGPLLQDPRDFSSIYADVLILPQGFQPVKLNGGAVYTWSSRVITADNDVFLYLEPTTTEDTVLTISASSLDKKVYFFTQVPSPPMQTILPVPGQTIPPQWKLLELGTANVSATITYTATGVSVNYEQIALPLEMASPELTRTLQTQLRIADVLFWRNPALATKLATHITAATVNSPAGAVLNMQAASLGQQLIATALTETVFAPVLQLSNYKRSIDEAISVASAFEASYNRLSDRQAGVQDQLAAWQTMLDKADDAAKLQNSLVQEALTKVTSAYAAVQDATRAYKTHLDDLAAKEAIFKVGLQVWKEHQIMKAVFDIAMAVTMIVAAVGVTIATGGLAAPAAEGTVAGAATTTVTTTTVVADEVEMGLMQSGSIGRLSTSEVTTTLKKSEGLAGYLKKIEKMSVDVVKLLMVLQQLFDLTNGTLNLVPVVENFLANPLAGLQNLKQDLTAVVAEVSELSALAAWDDWRNDVDEHLAFIQGQDIDGAEAYRTELYKHAVDGKLITQLQVQYIKAGQEYVHQALSLANANADLGRLKQLKSTFQGEIADLQQAKLLCYDQLMRIRNNVTIELRKATWAYRYLALKPSSVLLDPLKTIDQFKADALQITTEVETWQENYSSDFAAFSPPSMSLSKLLGNTFDGVLTALKANKTADFTMQPLSTTAGPFVGGSHFRIQGMRPYLVGIVASGAVTNIAITITNTGVYEDVTDDGKTMSFSMLPFKRTFKYSLPTISTVLGAAKPVWDASNVTIDSLVASADHVEPTPFASWTIKIQDQTNLDLSQLTDVLLMWKGTANFAS